MACENKRLKALPDNLYVSGLPIQFNNNDKALEEFFAVYGEIDQAKVLPTNPKTPSKVQGLIRFRDKEVADLLVAECAAGMPEGMTQLSVRFASTPTPSPKREAEEMKKAEEILSKGASKTRTDLSNFAETPAAQVSTWGAVLESTGSGGVPPIAQPLERYAPYGQKSDREGKGNGRKGYGADDVFCKLEAAGTLGQRKPHSDQASLYVAGLPTDTSDVWLYKIFSVFGPLVLRGIHAMVNPDGSCTGSAFVDYFQEESAQAAIEALNGTELPDGNRIFVSIKLPERKGKGKSKEPRDPGVPQAPTPGFMMQHMPQLVLAQQQGPPLLA